MSDTTDIAAPTDAAVATAMRELECDVLDLERFAIIAERLAWEACQGAFTKEPADLLNFATGQVSRHAHRLGERYELAYRGEVPK